MSEFRRLASENLTRDKFSAGPFHEQGGKLEADPARPMVFVLDDEPAVRDSLQCLLESARYTVRTFATPDQFLVTKKDRLVPGEPGKHEVEQTVEVEIPAAPPGGKPAPAPAPPAKE